MIELGVWSHGIETPASILSVLVRIVVVSTSNGNLFANLDLHT
jgi:hypothetical protein